MTEEIKASEPTLDDVAVNIGALYIIADTNIAKNKPDWIPCRAGCSWCCYSMNSIVTWVEAYYLLKEIKDWSEEDKKDLKDRAENEMMFLMADEDIAAVASAGTIKPDSRDKFNKALRRHIRPCPILDLKTGKCRAYEHRFMACRLFGSTVAQMGDEEYAGYYCNVVEEDAKAHPDEQLLNATPIDEVRFIMAGAPNVYAMPIASWIQTLVVGEKEGLGYSLDNVEPLFEKFMPMFQPLKLKEHHKEDSDAKNDVGPQTQ
jgi:Fe-S-cluster containining protein